jgi:hypothetical protein
LALGVFGAQAAAPRLFPGGCRLMTHQRLIPACASVPQWNPPVGDSFQVEALTTATGPNGGEANPGSARVQASIRSWRVYDEYLRAFGGFVVWVDNMEALGPCIRQREWLPFVLPNVAKLVTPDPRTGILDPPELQGGTYVGFAASACSSPIGSPEIRWSETTVQLRPGTELALSCVDDTQTTNQIFVHELGHLYHLDHVSVGASVMNDASNAAHPCRPRSKLVSEAKPDGELMAGIWDDLWSQGVLPRRRPSGFDVSGSSVAGSGTSPVREQSLTVVRGSWLFVSGVAHLTLMSMLDDLTGVDVEILAVPSPLFWEPNRDGDVDVTHAVSLGSQSLSRPFPAGNHQVFVPYLMTNTGLNTNRDYWIAFRVSQADGPEFDRSDDVIYTRHRVRVLE